jgi:hypothetical protein
VTTWQRDNEKIKRGGDNLFLISRFPYRFLNYSYCVSQRNKAASSYPYCIFKRNKAIGNSGLNHKNPANLTAYGISKNQDNIY